MKINHYVPLTKKKQPKWLVRKVISCHNNDLTKIFIDYYKMFLRTIREKFIREQAINEMG